MKGQSAEWNTWEFASLNSHAPNYPHIEYLLLDNAYIVQNTKIRIYLEIVLWSDTSDEYLDLARAVSKGPLSMD